VTAGDGRTTTGVIARQSSDVLVMRDSSGAEVRVLRGQIEGMTRAATSIMPEGLERPLSQEELRDLLAYLQSLK
jgi:putative heme-binding domain-containing protein